MKKREVRAKIDNSHLYPIALAGIGVYAGITLLRDGLGINHVDGYWLFSLYLAICNFLFFRSFPKVWDRVKRAVDLKRMALLIAFLIATAAIYSSDSPDYQQLAAYKNVHFAYLSHKYLLSKSLDILFQQAILTAFFFALLTRGYSVRRIQLSIAAGAGIVHLHTLFTLPLAVAIIFTLLSIAACVLWVKLLAISKHGCVYNYLSHWLFYLVAGIIFNLLMMR